MREVIVAKSAGFCFGVREALETVYKEIEKKNGPVFTYGPIIHNEIVLDDLAKKGVRILNSEEDLEKVTDGTVIIRSHGVGEKIYDICCRKRLKVVDATCPFVARIHRIVREKSRDGYRVIIIGDPHHPEVEGICGWGDEKTTAVESVEDFISCGPAKNEKICIAAQTTYNLTKFTEIVDKIRKLGYDIVCCNTICNATQERQKEAGSIASRVDCMIVIGSRTSSNTGKLVEICKEGCGNTIFIQTLNDLDPEALKAAGSIGITAGASTPKQLIEEVQVNVGREF